MILIARRAMPFARVMFSILGLLNASEYSWADTSSVRTHIPEIRRGGLVSGTEAWVQSADTLLWSDDAGVTWRDIAPTADPRKVHAVSFFGRTGAALVSNLESSEWKLLFTTDGGTHWSGAKAPDLPAPVLDMEASVVFGDSWTAWLFLTRYNSTVLLHTGDAGQTWTSLPSPPVSGQAIFESASHGRITPVAGIAADAIVTKDGGYTWSRVAKEARADTTRLGVVSQQAGPSISGCVRYNGRSLPGVTVTLSGPFSASTVTDAIGCYSIGGVTAGGQYQIAFTRNGYRFDPATMHWLQITGPVTCNSAAVLYLEWPMLLMTSTYLHTPVSIWRLVDNIPQPSLTDAPIVYYAYPGWKPVTAGDMSGDGLLDIVLQNYISNQVAVWQLGGPKGLTWKSDSFLPTPFPDWKVRATADFNRDGVTDVVLQNGYSNAVVIWYLGGPERTTVLSDPIVATASYGWVVFDSIDLDGNQVPDLVLYNRTSRSISVWLMGGTNGNQLLSFAVMKNTVFPMQPCHEFSYGDCTSDENWKPVRVIRFGSYAAVLVHGRSSRSVVALPFWPPPTLQVTRAISIRQVLEGWAPVIAQ